MSLTFGSSAAMPYLCGVYTCECGKKATQHGRRAATLPLGWRHRRDADGSTRHVCPACLTADPGAAGADEPER